MLSFMVDFQILIVDSFLCFETSSENTLNDELLEKGKEQQKWKNTEHRSG